MNKLSLTEEQKDTAAVAAQLLIDHGWIQNSYGNEECGFCAVGAIGEATEIYGNPYSDRIAVEFAIEHKVGNFPTRWNDEKDRTMEEVVGILQEIAEGK